MKSIQLKSLILGAMIGAAALFGIAAVERAATEYEYKFVYQTELQQHVPLESMEQAVNRFAAQGWEPIAVSATEGRGQNVLLKRAKR
jgi:hypothetical protein